MAKLPKPKKGRKPKKIGADKWYGPGGPKTPGAKKKKKKARKKSGY